MFLASKNEFKNVQYNLFLNASRKHCHLHQKSVCNNIQCAKKNASKNKTPTINLIKILGNIRLLTLPSPKPTFCPKWEVSVNVGLGKGGVGGKLPRIFASSQLHFKATLMNGKQKKT